MSLVKFIRQKEWSWRVLMRKEGGQLSDAANTVLADLRTFCYGTKSIYSNDALMMARLEGRREVYMRIMNFLNIDYSKQLELEEDFQDDGPNY